MRSRQLIFVFAAAVLWAGGARAADADDFRFHSYPNPFVAGYTAAKFVYTLPSAATISLYIYDAEGPLVRTLATTAARSRGFHDNDERWDGRDENGEFVAPGPYVAVLEVRTQGEVYRVSRVVIVKR